MNSAARGRPGSRRPSSYNELKLESALAARRILLHLPATIFPSFCMGKVGGKRRSR